MLATRTITIELPDDLVELLGSPEDLAGVVTAAREALFNSRPGST